MRHFQANHSTVLSFGSIFFKKKIKIRIQINFKVFVHLVNFGSTQ